MKTGIALSGGGTRGFAHAGVLKAMDEIGIKLSAISGASVGAVIGAYYAAGFPVNEIVAIVKGAELFKISALRFLKPGLFKTDAVRASLDKHLSGLTFEGLKIPLFVNATDFENNKCIYLSEGILVDALLASSAIPGIFNPVELNGMKLVDGALLNNFPIEPLLPDCASILGVHTNPVGHEDVSTLKIRSVIDRSFHIAISGSIMSKKEKCTLFLEPPALSKYGMFDFDDAEAIAALGYEYAMQHKKELEKIGRDSQLS